MPLKLDGKRIETPLPYTGEYLDGFGNHVTMLAYVNPDPANAKKYGGEWGAKADGHAIVRFNTNKRTITMECWPRGVDVTKANAPQYPGWPITITQEDNYGREAKAYLPTISVKGIKNPVIQIVDEKNNETVYTLRINGTTFRPKVFHDGTYTIKLGEMPDNMKTLNMIRSLPSGTEKTLNVKF